MESPDINDQKTPAARRLLLVEDYGPLAETTAEFLRSAGLEVQIAQNGRDALTLVAQFRPEIVLCDLRLPDMTGVDILRELRKDSSTRNVLFVIHTAFEATDFGGVGFSGVDLF